MMTGEEERRSIAEHILCKAVPGLGVAVQGVSKPLTQRGLCTQLHTRVAHPNPKKTIYARSDVFCRYIFQILRFYNSICRVHGGIRNSIIRIEQHGGIGLDKRLGIRV